MSFRDFIERTYLATASSIIRPGGLYRINAAVLPDSPDLIIRAVVTKDGHQVASSNEVVEAGSNQNIIMKVFRYLSLQ